METYTWDSKQENQECDCFKRRCSELFRAAWHTKKEAWVKKKKICVHCQIAKSIHAVSWDTKFANNSIFSW